MTSYHFEKEDLQHEITKFNGNRVLIIGDIMVDEYLIGDVERISPEAPVPVVHVTEERHLVGGAGNVARNILSLGGKPTLISVCGTGVRSQLLKRVLDEQHIQANLLAIAGRPTTIKTRVIARQQQMVRIDKEEVSPITGAHLDALLQRVEESICGHRVIIVSDYGKGVVTQEFMQRLRILCNAQPTPPAIFIDPKTPNFHLYTGVTLLTPNAKETGDGAGLLARTQEEILSAGDAIFQKLTCQHLLTTLGASGMALFVSSDEVWHIPTVAQRVFDVTGAGDTVIATVALAYASGIELLPSCILANYAAGIVVGQVGAACVLPEELAKTIATLPVPAIHRWR